jgi:hypothetical protein
VRPREVGSCGTDVGGCADGVVLLCGMCQELLETLTRQLSGKHPSGAKALIDLSGFVGTTKVVPCYKAQRFRWF